MHTDKLKYWVDDNLYNRGIEMAINDSEVSKLLPEVKTLVNRVVKKKLG